MLYDRLSATRGPAAARPASTRQKADVL
jgi:hypothetical protein